MEDLKFIFSEGELEFDDRDCDIFENNDKELKFDDENMAKEFIEKNKENRLEYNFQLFEVKEKK